MLFTAMVLASCSMIPNDVKQIGVSAIEEITKPVTTTTTTQPTTTTTTTAIIAPDIPEAKRIDCPADLPRVPPIFHKGHCIVRHINSGKNYWVNGKCQWGWED